MTPAKFAEEIFHYRKLVKAQRKVLESLSQKVLAQEKTSKLGDSSDKRILNLKEQLEYYKAKSKVLEREVGKKPNLTKLIFEEIQRSRSKNKSLE
jgi:small-conductance mechanosensitive channel